VWHKWLSTCLVSSKLGKEVDSAEHLVGSAPWVSLQYERHRVESLSKVNHTKYLF
jgi:hypothetical protein